MRLTPETRQVIKELVLDVFGSRENDEARGGDIDLLVECSETVKDKLRKTLVLTARLQCQLGDQRIDVIVADPQTKPQSVHDVARKTGVPL